MSPHHCCCNSENDTIPPPICVTIMWATSRARFSILENLIFGRLHAKCFSGEPLEAGVGKQAYPCLTSTWCSHLYGVNVSRVWCLLACRCWLCFPDEPCWWWDRAWLQRALLQSWLVFLRDLPSAVRSTETQAWRWGQKDLVFLLHLSILRKAMFPKQDSKSYHFSI